MRTIIAGSRSIIDYTVVNLIITESKIDITTVISGRAPGVDRLGERWAKENNIPVIAYLAEWDKLGKRAGYVRNETMAKNADALIAIWDGKSRGTKHMVDLGYKYGLELRFWHV